MSNIRALRNGISPGSSRCTSAPSARKSSSEGSLRRFKPLITASRRAVVGKESLPDPRERHFTSRHFTSHYFTSSGHLDEDLQGLLGFQQPHHFLVAVKTRDRVSEDALGDSGIRQLAVRERLDAEREVAAVAVDARDEQLVAEYPFQID